MALSILLLSNPLVIFIISAAIITLIAIIVNVIERGLHKEVKLKKELEENKYVKRIKFVIDSRESLRRRLEEVNVIVKDFFYENFKLSKQLSYYEILEKFKKKKKPKVAEFCKRMIDALYSGEEFDVYKLNRIINIFVDIQKDFKKELEMNKSKKKISEMKERIKIQPIQNPPQSLRQIKGKPTTEVKKETKKDGIIKKLFYLFVKKNDESKEIPIKKRKEKIFQMEGPDETYEDIPNLKEKDETIYKKEGHAIYGFDDLNRIKDKIDKKKSLVKGQ